MEKAIRRTPFQAKVTDDCCVKDADYQQYKLQTRGEYEDLMMEFEFRCKRAATMHYYEASGYDRKIYHMELLSAIIGSISATSVGVYFLKGSSLPSMSSISTAAVSPSSFSGNLGAAGTFGMGVVFILQMLGKGTMKILPSFSTRQQLHITAAAAWQKLAMKTRSFRIQLDNPRLDVENYQTWYMELVDEREKLCTLVTLPQATYRLYCDPLRVYRPMKQRRTMYLKYLQLEDMNIHDATDDLESEL